MKVAIPIIVSLVSLTIAPGLFFRFDVTPKVLVLLLGVSVLLLVSLRHAVENVKELYKVGLVRWFFLLLFGQCIWFGIACARSVDPALSIYGGLWRRWGLLTFLTVIIFVVIATGWLAQNRRHFTILFRTLTCTGVVVALYGIAQYFGWDPLLPSKAYLAGDAPFTIVRPPSTFGHADYFAGWLVPVLFVAWGTAKLEVGTHSARFSQVAALLMAVAIVLSGTRSALLGLIVGAIAYVAAGSVRMSRRNVVSVAGCLVICAMLIASPAGQKLRARARWSSEDKFGGARILLWRDSLQMLAARPLIGFGPEAFGTEFPHFESVALARVYPDFYHESPHNIMLDMALSAGVPAGALLLGMCALAFYVGRRGDLPQELFRVPLVAGLAGLLVTQLFMSFVLPTALLLYLLMGCLIAVAANSQLPDWETSNRSGKLRVPFGLLLAVPMTLYGVLLAIGDINMARAEIRMKGGDSEGAAAAYRLALRWRTEGAADDLSYSRRMFSAARTSPLVNTRKEAMQQALDAGIRATNTAEDRQNAWYSLAMILAVMNDPAGVERSLRMAVQAAPRWFKPHWALARLLELQHRHFQAIAEASTAAELDGGKNTEVSETLSKLLANPSVK